MSVQTAMSGLESLVRKIDEIRAHLADEASIYRTQGGGFVVSATYRTDWAHEREYRWASAVENTAAAVKWLQGLDVLGVVAGYPDVPRFRSQHDRLLDSLQDQWDWLVGELLAQCDEFAEVVA